MKRFFTRKKFNSSNISPFFLNSADDRLSLKATSGFTTYVKVRHDGNQTWRAHIIYKSMCNINVKYFPFDEQTCKLVFASWSHDISTLDLRERRGLPGGRAVAKKKRGSDVFQENEEWTVEWINIEREEVRFILQLQCHAIAHYTSDNYFRWPFRLHSLQLMERTKADCF